MGVFIISNQILKSLYMGGDFDKFEENIEIFNKFEKFIKFRLDIVVL